jgi:hypothetical protein
MKQWQEKVPTLNLVLLCIIIFIFMITGFLIGPVNQVTINNDEVLNRLFSRYSIESCQELDYYYINTEMYRVNCSINEVSYYFFLDKNGIIHKQLRVDKQKELLDLPIIKELYQLNDSEFNLVYYNDQLAYLVVSDEYEYVINYENYNLIMKVRF